MSNGPSGGQPDESNLTRRDTLAAGVLGLGLVGAGTASATSAEENDDDDDEGDGGGSSRFAVREHDHSGEFGGTSSLGAEAPVESIAVDDIINSRQPVFDIRAYGAVGDGETDCTWAIHEAIEDAAEVNGTVFFPRGDWVSDWIILRHEHSGITLTGTGYGSRIIPLQAVHPEDAFTWEVYGPGGEIDIEPTNFVFQIMLNDNFSPPPGTHPASLGEFGFNYREPEPFENITIRNLRLDGRKNDITDDPGGRGISATDQQLPLSDNIVIENIFAHDYKSHGMRLALGRIVGRRLVCTNNDYVGLSLGSQIEGTPDNLFTNVVCTNNGEVGFLTRYNILKLANFSFTHNGARAQDDDGAGMLILESPRLFITNGRIRENDGYGINAHRTFQAYLNNIESQRNEFAGYRLGAGNWYVGQIASINNNRSGESSGSVEVLTPREDRLITNVSADRIVASVSGGPGVVVEDDTEFRVSDLQSWFHDGPGLEQHGGRVVVQDGTIWNNGKAGIRANGGERTVLHNVRAKGSHDVGIDIGSGAGDVTLQNLDLQTTTTPVQITDGVEPTIENVAGFRTDAGGIATFSGDGSTTAFTVEHGLATAPTRLNVTPDLSTDASTVAGVQNLSGSSFEVVIDSAPASGSDNVAVSWTAAVY